MATLKKEELNKTQGKDVELACVKCAGKTSHKVMVSVDRSGEESDGQWSVQWNSHYQIVQCNGCKSNTFRTVSSNTEDYYQVSETEYEYAENESLYPSRVEGRQTLEDDIHYLPRKVQHIYTETIQALNGNSPILAGIGLRALIETVCKEHSASGRNLLLKIDDLVVKNILTPAGSLILHKIRTLGNDAAHEVNPHSEKQLGLAMDVAEHLLKDVYILPKKVEDEFNE